MLKLIVFIGIFLFPIFTLGCVLIHYNHPVLGIIAIAWSIFTEHLREEKKKKEKGKGKGYNDIID